MFSNLKTCVRYFSGFFYQMTNLWNLWKMLFNSSRKILFVPEIIFQIFRFLYFCLSLFFPCRPNLVSNTSFRYKREAKKRPWKSSNMWLKFAQIEGIFFKINYGICGQRCWKHRQFYCYVFKRLVCRASIKIK